MRSPEAIRKKLLKTQTYSLVDAQMDLSEFATELGISGGLMELKIPAAILTSDILHL